MQGCAISDEWSFRGIETVILENDELRIVVLSGKGTDISEITFKPLSLNLLFRNPWGPKSTKDFPPISPHPEVFRDYTGGGWSDIIPNAGAPCHYKGATLGLHDETPLLSWSSEILDRSKSEVSARFKVELKKFPISVEKQISLNESNLLTIQEKLTNLSASQDVHFSWLTHPTFSWEFVNGAEIEVDAKRISRIGDGINSKIDEFDFPSFREVSGSINREIRAIPKESEVLNDTLVMSGLKTGRYSIANNSIGLGFTLDWPIEIFPYLWYYRSVNSQDYPYYGRSKFIALEPCTSLRSGLESQVLANDSPTLRAGASLTANIRASVIPSKR